MKIKTQKIIRFIPIINIITMFAWIRLCFSVTLKPFDFVRELIKMFAWFFGISVIRIIFAFGFENETLDLVLTYISMYFYLLVMAIVSVNAQEKLLAKNQNHE